jgi:hypothetical protein
VKLHERHYLSHFFCAPFWDVFVFDIVSACRFSVCWKRRIFLECCPFCGFDSEILAVDFEVFKSFFFWVRWLFVACTFVAVTFVAVTFVAPKIMSFRSRLQKSDIYVAPNAYVALIVDGMSFSKLVSDLL